MKTLELCFATNTPRNTIVYSSAITACDKAGQWCAAASPRRSHPPLYVHCTSTTLSPLHLPSISL